MKVLFDRRKRVHVQELNLKKKEEEGIKFSKKKETFQVNGLFVNLLLPTILFSLKSL